MQVTSVFLNFNIASFQLLIESAHKKIYQRDQKLLVPQTFEVGSSNGF